MRRGRPRRARWRVQHGLALAIAGTLAGCDLAPVYEAPHYVLPDTWRGQAPFARAEPGDELPRGPWWERFGDLRLDALEQQCIAQNPNLAAMYEQYVQARDAAAVARSGLYPQLSVNGQTSYQKESRNATFRNPQSVVPTTAANNLIQAGATWEPDFWQRIRNGERMQARLAQSSAALLASARLSLEVQLANSYFALRGLDVQTDIYRRAVENYGKSVEITQLRLRGAIGAGLDVARAQSQLASAQALLSATLASRTVLEHAIAVLAGVNPSTFSIPAEVRDGFVTPVVPVTVPARLLERRPDIASAERQMAAANANIGITRAAFYPNVTLSATGGFQDTGFNLASLPNSLWSIGASAVLPLFEGGLRRAELQQSWSQFAQTRDNYRATVLTAFREVEDGLTLFSSLTAQNQAQLEAVQAAGRAMALTQQLYVGGVSPYLDVVVAQQTALLADVAAAQARTALLQTSADLILALGGGWSTADLPTERGVLPFDPLDIAHADWLPRPDGTERSTGADLRPPR